MTVLRLPGTGVAGPFTGGSWALADVAAPVASTGREAFWGAPRAPLTLAVSDDGGLTWPHRRNLEIGDGFCMTNNSKDKLNREFSYPSLCQSADGTLHVAYTYWRQAIKYVRVSEAWIRSIQA